MRYRQEDDNGDYTLGSGDNSFLQNTPETVAQAIKTRVELWQREWFLNINEGTPYQVDVLGKYKSPFYNLAIRERVLDTQGVVSIIDFSSQLNANTRKLTYNITVDTVYGQTTLEG